MTFEIALLGSGVLLLLIGLIGHINVKEFELGSNSKAIRIVTTLVGAGLIMLAVQQQNVGSDLKAEQYRLSAEKAEQDRLAAEKTEQDRLAARKAEQDQLAAERTEQDRLATQIAEQDRLAAEEAEQDRLATPRETTGGDVLPVAGIVKSDSVVSYTKTEPKVAEKLGCPYSGQLIISSLSGRAGSGFRIHSINNSNIEVYFSIEYLHANKEETVNLPKNGGWVNSNISVCKFKFRKESSDNEITLIIG